MQRTMAVVCLAGAVILFGAACGGGYGTSNTPPANTVQVGYNNTNVYYPTLLTVAVNTTVTWDWKSGTHDVTSEGAPGFPSSGGPFSAPHTYTNTFTVVGTYNFRCTPHSVSPGTGGMRGTIVVQ